MGGGLGASGAFGKLGIGGKIGENLRGALERLPELGALVGEE